MNILKKTQSQLRHLSKSERKVAKAILALPDNAIHSDIAAMALEANINEPTVNRFCRSMDTRGSPDFKLHLAQNLANGTLYANRNTSEDDGVESYAGKIPGSAMAIPGHVRHSLDKSATDRAVDSLTQAKKVAFFGLGSSAAVAHDVINKFFRFNVLVVCSDDIVLQRMSCMNCSGGDAVVLISHTGKTESLIELTQLARENDAMVIALTSADTPFTQGVTLTIVLDVPEDTNVYTSMVSRLTQLTMIDILMTGFTLRRDVKSRDNLKRTKEALKKSCLDEQLLNLSDDRQKRLSLS